MDFVTVTLNSKGCVISKKNRLSINHFTSYKLQRLYSCIFYLKNGYLFFVRRKCGSLIERGKTKVGFYSNVEFIVKKIVINLKLFPSFWVIIFLK